MATEVKMKGTPVGVMVVANQVQVWVSSPTGDSTDSFIYNIPCVNEQQAEVIAETWRKVWGL